MATPVGHALAGYAVYGVCGTSKEGGQKHLLILSVMVAISPDFDLLPGILMGKPAVFHQGITHSVGFAMLVSFAIAGIYCMRGKAFVPIFRVCLFAYFSHLLIDFFGPDLRIPYGIPLFWPITSEHFISPVHIFPGVRHASSTSASTLELVRGVLDVRNLRAIGVEIAVISPLIFLAWRYKRGRLA